MTTCPYGYTHQWSTLPEFMGRVCIQNSNQNLAILVGATCGIILCFALIILSIFLIKTHHRKKLMQQHFIEETNERTIFLNQVDSLRSNVHILLAILNDSRRQFRKLHLSGDVNGAMSYRPVIRDLAKILIILNKPNEIIAGAPTNWNRISTWAERLLESNRPTFEQLIEFSETNRNPIRDLGSFQYSTFKSNATATTSDEQQLFGSLISLHEFKENRSSNPFKNMSDVKCYYPTSELNSSSLWLEDEFFKLGLRPQDEITTEL